MNKSVYPLWAEDDMIARSGSGKGTFVSCKPSMEFFRAKSDTTPGCIIICPGGGYQTKSMDKEGKKIAKFLNANSISAFVLDYRVAPDYNPAPISDVIKAVEIARQLAVKLGYAEDKVGVMGFSAGGHLAACAGTMWSNPMSRPDAMVLCYPVITMGKGTHALTRANLIGDNITENTISDLSCENRVNRQTPPAFIWHTFEDTDVSVENSLIFASALASKSIPFELHVFPHGPHALGLAQGIPSVESWPALCVNWLHNLGF